MRVWVLRNPCRTTLRGFFFYQNIKVGHFWSRFALRWPFLFFKAYNYIPPWENNQCHQHHLLTKRDSWLFVSFVGRRASIPEEHKHSACKISLIACNLLTINYSTDGTDETEICSLYSQGHSEVKHAGAEVKQVHFCVSLRRLCETTNRSVR